MTSPIDDDTVAVVIDSGSFMCKVGLGGDDAPKSVFPSVVGRPKYDTARRMAGLTKWETYIGDIARKKRGILDLNYPIERGVVTDWDDMEKIWQHAFCHELSTSPDNHTVFLTDSALSPKSNRETMAEIMLEKFNARGFHACLQSILSMFASGRNCGVVLDCGDGVTQVIGLTEGHYSIRSSVNRLDLAGSDLTNSLTRLLLERGYSLTGTTGFEIVREMKEKLCYTALDFDQEMAKEAKSPQLSQNYELPDGQVITIGSERFRCPEAMFRPSLIGQEHEGVHKMVYNTLMNCDIDLRADLMVNFIISGGSTMFPGFPERLQKELRLLCPSHMRVKVVAQPYRAYSAWIGGSILSSLSYFKDIWITKAQYDEEGPNIVHRRCN